MITYIMIDIHGFYDDFLSMLEKINFSNTDQLIMAGDYIDRGKQSYEMLKWIEQCPSNILLLRGNHEEEFAAYVDLMLQLDCKKGLKTDFASNADTAILYDSVKYFIRCRALSVVHFDWYGTVRFLLECKRVTLDDLLRWSAIIRQMPYYHKLVSGNRTCVIVHAGYSEKLEDICASFGSMEQFCLYAREESCRLGGVQHGMIISGHTPTIVKDSFAYHDGEVFRFYDKEKDCVFYDIDCGCVFRNRKLKARLACIRLEDEKIFYI